MYFNPPSFVISIHALLAESDRFQWVLVPSVLQFLSTLSLRRATIKTYRKKQGLTHFYPRSPCGERRKLRILCIFTISFLSTLSLRRATRVTSSVRSQPSISIHALLAESDVVSSAGTTGKSNFYPRSPCGERHLRRFILCGLEHFYPRSPCGERPRPSCRRLHSNAFLSTLSLRRATRIDPDQVPG